MLKKMTTFCAILFCGLPLCASAQTAIDCRGTLAGAILYANGAVSIQGSWRNDWTMICNTQTNWNDIDTSTCLAWYAAAVKASGSQLTVGLVYNTTYTCATLPTYNNSIAPVYFRIFSP